MQGTSAATSAGNTRDAETNRTPEPDQAAGAEATRANQEAKAWSEARDRANLLETRLSHEFNLMGQRMTWMVTSQSFLFAAWVQLIKTATDTLSPDGRLLLFVVPLIGFGVALAGWFAIDAAMRMVDTLVIDRAAVDGLLGLTPMSSLRPHPATRFSGHVPTVLLPPLFMAAWCVVSVWELWPDRWPVAVPTVLFAAWLCLRLLGTWIRHRDSKILAAIKAAGEIKYRSPAAHKLTELAFAREAIRGGVAVVRKGGKRGEHEVRFRYERVERDERIMWVVVVNVCADHTAYLAGCRPADES